MYMENSYIYLQNLNIQIFIIIQYKNGNTVNKLEESKSTMQNKGNQTQQKSKEDETGSLAGFNLSAEHFFALPKKKKTVL